MPKLILVRHIKSQWNDDNRFTGWMDVPLAEEEVERAKDLADQIFKTKIDKIYSSPLFRNMDTVSRIFGYGNPKYPVFVHMDKGKMKDWGHFVDISEDDVSVYLTSDLNERYYGKLQGESKEKMREKYGEKTLHLWRRSYNVAPPGGESLKDVCRRTHPFFHKHPEKDLKEGKNVLIVASHNSLRAIIKKVENISDEDIINLEVPYGGLLEYEYGGGVYKKLKAY